MSVRRSFLRNAGAGGDLEVFLVAAVSAILVIRFGLRVTGYPQLGGDSLHVAHMLWGGLLMVAALVVLLSFLDRASRRLAALAGGVGFGTFIDEVGKFVTHDNDYFYQPAVAIMYGIFVLVYLAIRTMHGEGSLSHSEHLLNAVQELEEVVRHDLDDREKRRALDHLRRSDPDHPLVGELQAVLKRVAPLPAPRAGRLVRAKNAAAEHYRRLVGHPLFAPGLIAFFVLQATLSLVHVTALIFGWRVDPDQAADGRLTGAVVRRLQGVAADPGLLDWSRLATSLLSAAFVLAGVFLLGRDRLGAYAMFRRSVLVTIFLTQVLIFYTEEFAALLGLTFNILVLAALRYVSERERDADPS